MLSYAIHGQVLFCCFTTLYMQNMSILRIIQKKGNCIWVVPSGPLHRKPIDFFVSWLFLYVGAATIDYWQE